MEAGNGGIFRGLRFRLFGFDAAKEDEYRKSITEKGGLIDKLYIWKELYLVVSSEKISYGDPYCVKARENGAIVINELWIDHSLENGTLADTDNVLYRPLMALSGIKDAQNLKISHTGFSCQESRCIERLVEMIGAENVDIRDCTYLICNGVQDYEAAKGMELFTVNRKWLEESAIQWEMLSVDGYVSWPKRANSRNYRTPVKDSSARHKEREVSSTGKKSKNRDSPEKRNVIKRQVLSTGSKKSYPPEGEPFASFVRRKLNFNLRQLSEFQSSEMVVKVRIPRSKHEKEIGTNDFKGALLGSYAAMANYHLGGECIRNSFSASSFTTSRISDQVKMELPQLVQYDEQLALANRRDFVLMVQGLFKEKHLAVPVDIAVWLSCILDVDKVPDAVLKHHMNMQHPVEVYGNFISMYYILLKMKQEDPTQFTLIMDSDIMYKYKFSVKQFRFRCQLLSDTVQYINPKTVELNRLRSQQGGQAVMCKPKERADNLFGILEVVRDCFIHPAMVHKDLLLPMLLPDFPRLLSDLQRKLYELGHLKNLK